MSQWGLKANGNVVPQRTTRPLQTSKLNSNTEKTKRKCFDALIARWWVVSIYPPLDLIKEQEYFEEYMDDDESPRVIPEA